MKRVDKIGTLRVPVERVASLVFADGTFALKGGTAINLFIRDMPRLSVDPDLVFPDHRLPRDEALARINEAVRLSAERLKARGFQTHLLATADAGETKLLVRRAGIEVMGWRLGRGSGNDGANPARPAVPSISCQCAWSAAFLLTALQVIQ